LSFFSLLFKVDFLSQFPCRTQPRRQPFLPSLRRSTIACWPRSTRTCVFRHDPATLTSADQEWLSAAASPAWLRPRPQPLLGFQG
jgi:hypothetical protein